MKIPFDMEYQFNSSLKEVPNNHEEFQKGLEFLHAEIQRSSGLKKARLLSNLGTYQRIDDKLEESLNSLTQASELIQAYPDHRLKCVNDLRIAQTLQFKKNFVEAENQYNRLEKECRADAQLKDLLDFVLQHSGKCQFDQKDHDGAIARFSEAMELRISKGDEDLIRSTQFALDRIKEILAE